MSDSCKCPFKHHLPDPSIKVPEKGSELYPDVHQFDDIVEKVDISQEEQYAIDLFKDLLRIPSVSADVPLGSAKQCINFFSTICDRYGITWETLEYTAGFPIFFATIKGINHDTKTSILLNSHYDVVPVVRERWTYDPFNPIELDNGDIIARGAQDMKCVCIHHIYTVLQILRDAYNTKNKINIPLYFDNNTNNDIITTYGKDLGTIPLLDRTVHIAIMPDEELGGPRGMGKWVISDHFKTLNIGYALDEGIASDKREIIAFHGERTVWWFKLYSTGPTGHGSRFIQGTAMEKLLCAVNSMLALRDSEYHRLHKGDENSVGCAHAKALQLGDVTTLNLTMLQGGMKSDSGEYALNVIPSEAWAGFDVRIPPHIDIVIFEKQLRDMLPPGVEIQFVVKTENNHVSEIGDHDPFWNAIQDTCKEHNISLRPEIFPSATDGRWLRNVKHIPVIGFTPLFNQPMLLHDHDERLNKYIFIQGMRIMKTAIEKLVNV